METLFNKLVQKTDNETEDMKMQFNIFDKINKEVNEKI